MAVTKGTSSIATPQSQGSHSRLCPPSQTPFVESVALRVRKRERASERASEREARRVQGERQKSSGFGRVMPDAGGSQESRLGDNTHQHEAREGV
eukprot:1632763-Rhodomonas_salina.1